MTPALLFPLMCLATYGITRLVTADDLSEWFRDSLHDLAEKHGGRFTYYAMWAECPWCIGAWLSFAVVAWTAQFADVPLPLLQAWAVRCVVGILGKHYDA